MQYSQEHLKQWFMQNLGGKQSVLWGIGKKENDFSKKA